MSYELNPRRENSYPHNPSPNSALSLALIPTLLRLTEPNANQTLTLTLTIILQITGTVSFGYEWGVVRADAGTTCLPLSRAHCLYVLLQLTADFYRLNASFLHVAIACLTA